MIYLKFLSPIALERTHCQPIRKNISEPIGKYSKIFPLKVRKLCVVTQNDETEEKLFVLMMMSALRLVCDFFISNSFATFWLVIKLSDIIIKPTFSSLFRSSAEALRNAFNSEIALVSSLKITDKRLTKIWFRWKTHRLSCNTISRSAFPVPLSASLWYPRRLLLTWAPCGW